MSLPPDHDPREDLPQRDPRPQIALRSTGLPTPLLIALAAVLALALFLMLNARRQARLNEGQASSTTSLPPAPPPLAIPPPPPPPPAPVIIHDAPPAAPAPPPAPMRPPPQPLPMPEMPRQSFMAPVPEPGPKPNPGPALVVDLTPGTGVPTTDGMGSTGLPPGDDTVRATLIRNRASIIPQGAIITAVLETPLNSDRPGLARAIVTHDARGFDGTRVLIPRGSRLFGEFKADNSPGLRRILVTWSRLIRPDGVAIRIGSPVSDTLGGAGVPGSVDTHFFARFAGAVLQSALAVGVNLASQSSTSANTVYLGLPSQTTQLPALIPDANRPPTVKVREGAEIAVMVAHDLDFSGTPAVR